MFYEWSKSFWLRLLAVDPNPPDEPFGLDHDKVMVFRAAPEFLTYRMLGFWLLFCVLALTALVSNIALLVEGGPAAVLLALVIDLTLVFVLMLGYFSLRIDYDMRIYIVTDRSLRIREGVWLNREMTLTFANIQNIKVEQGPLERWLGIKNVVVETAGGGSQAPGGAKHAQQFSFHVGYLRGIKNAEEVSQLLRQRMERSHLQKQPDSNENALSELNLLREILAQTKELKIGRQ